jgi:hypothetical protein
MTRDEILETAAELISGDRQETYGSAYDSHARIADMWAAYLNGVMKRQRSMGYHTIRLCPTDVAAMMVLMKVSRSVNSEHADNWIDIAGYAALAGEMESEGEV